MKTNIHFETFTWSSICSDHSAIHSLEWGGADHLTHWNLGSYVTGYIRSRIPLGQKLSEPHPSVSVSGCSSKIRSTISIKNVFQLTNMFIHPSLGIQLDQLLELYCHINIIMNNNIIINNNLLRNTIFFFFLDKHSS